VYLSEKRKKRVNGGRNRKKKRNWELKGRERVSLKIRERG